MLVLPYMPMLAVHALPRQRQGRHAWHLNSLQRVALAPLPMQATSSSCPNSTWMVAPITCAACDVFFTNNCSLPVQLAVHSQLFDDKAPGFCAGTYNKKGDWCTRAGFALAPGETSSRALGQVYLGNFFFWASATDANNRTADWTDEAAADAPYVDLLTGNKCSPEDAITCKLFRSVRLDRGREREGGVRGCTLPSVLPGRAGVLDCAKGRCWQAPQPIKTLCHSAVQSVPVPQCQLVMPKPVRVHHTALPHLHA